MSRQWNISRFQGAYLVAALLLLVLLPAVGCADDDPQPAEGRIDLLSLSPSQPPAAPGPARGKRIGWDFSDGLPAGWSAGPPGVELHLEQDGVRLEHPDQQPWLELRCGGEQGDPRLPADGIDPLAFSRINVSMLPQGAEEAAVYFSSVEPARYQRNLRARVVYRQAGDRKVHGFNFPGAGGFETGIRMLRLYPALVRNSAVVRRAALVPRAPDYLTEHFLSRDWVSLGQHYRRCWRLVGPGVRETSLRLPDAPAVLQLALGRLVGEDGARLDVELLDRLGETQQLLGVDVPASGIGWKELEADLAAWAGQQVTLRFRVSGDDPGAVTLVGSPALLPAVAPPGSRPFNVLLILVDTLRADRLSLYGGGERLSPHLDRLARQGVVFTDALAPSSWTLPSVAALLTGVYPGKLKVGTGQGDRLEEAFPTMAEGFARAGYDTAGWSANFILNPAKGYARGFDLFYLAPYKEYTMPAGELNRRLLGWVAERGERPFFCYVQYMDPHSPYSPPGSDRYRVTNADSFQPRGPVGYRQGDIYPMVIGHEQLESLDHVGMVAGCYDDEVRYVDHQIGRLLASMEQQGLLERTVVMLVSDHGEELHDRGFWSHGYTLYQEQLHVPLIVKFPEALSGDNDRGEVSRKPVSLVDVLPTLYRLAGIGEADPVVAGQSLFQQTAERGLISETWAGDVPPRFCLRRGPWKYVLFNREALAEAPARFPGRWIWNHGPGVEELYNLEEDPGEQHNLAAERPEVARSMRQELEQRFGVAAVTAEGSDKDQKIDRDTEERLRALGYIK